MQRARHGQRIEQDGRSFSLPGAVSSQPESGLLAGSSLGKWLVGLAAEATPDLAEVLAAPNGSLF